MIFTALSGDAASTSEQPLAYVLQIDDTKILFDCGSPEWLPEPGSEYDWSGYCSELERIAPSIDLVLLSHGDLLHCGLYAYAHAHWGLHAPTYSSLPAQALGKIAVTEEAENVRAVLNVDSDENTVDSVNKADDGDAQAEASTSSTPPVTEDSQLKREGKEKEGTRRPLIATSTEIGTAFDSITTLRYSQPTHLSGKCQGITITAYNAGHTLGGTMWKVRSASSGTILYTVHSSHVSDHHLEHGVLISAAGVFEPLSRPDLFIIDARRMTNPVRSQRKIRDEVLLDTITTTLTEHRKSILMPCDTSARLLELLLMLDQHWEFARLRVPICLVSRTGKEMVTLIRSLVEWMNPSALMDDDETGTATLKFKHLTFFPSPAALLQAHPLVPPPSSRSTSAPPILILSVPASLSHGPSRELFATFASISSNLVLLTQEGETGSLTRELWSRWKAKQAEYEEGAKSKAARLVNSNIGIPHALTGDVLSLTMHSKVPLEGEELEAHLSRQQEEKERSAAALGALARSQRMLEADEGGDDSSSDSGSDRSSMDEDAELDRARMDVDGEGVGGQGTGTMDWSMLEDTAEDSQMRAQQLSFDIYLRGNTVARTAKSFFKSSTGAGAQNGEADDEGGDAAGEEGGVPGGEANEGLTRYRMFPMIERRRRVDAYGEVLDVGAWMRRGKALEEEAKGANGAIPDAVNPDGEADAVVEDTEIPSKFVTTTVEVPLQCEVFYVDKQGLDDARMTAAMVTRSGGRKFILVNCSDEAAEALMKAADQTIKRHNIFHPAAGEPITVGQQTNTYSILLSDEVLETIHMSKLQDNQVGHVFGRIQLSADSSIPILEPALAPTASKSNRSLPSSIPSSSSPSSSAPDSKSLVPRIPSSLPRSTIIGNLSLTALKNKLTALGFGVSLPGGGDLVCEAPNGAVGPVVVRKLGNGRVVLEGEPSAMYYKVREEVYGLHAIVAS